ncbi:MAG: BMP family ABC transporter substrate-binding protein, partial [Oribacterium parvum]|nr:BMP family ABC transporter substrate-binding protein [Oribacterium parvum]
MKKRIFAAFLALTMAFSLAACGASGGEKKESAKATEQGSEKGTEAGSEKVEESKAEKKDASSGKGLKVGIVTDVGGVNDGSFNQSAWEGLQRAQKELGIEAKYLESKTDADYKPNIETFVDEDYDLIICIGYALADALKAESASNPDVKFAIVDDASLADVSNVTSLMFEQAQVSYLAGYVAGKTTKKNTVGIVLGMATDMMNQFGYGYTAGVLDANASAKVLQANANSFADTAAGKTAANNMVTNGADVIFQVAGGTGLGVIDACKEAKIWAIGVDSDQSSIAPETILTSAMKRVDNAVFDVSKELVEGNIKGGVKTYTLADEGVDLAPGTENIDPAVVKEVEEIKKKIVSG